MREIQSWDRPSPVEIEERIKSARPAVLRGIASDWPLVRAARQSVKSWVTMLAEHSTESPVDVIRTGPEYEGRFHYTPDGLALNFDRARTNLPTLLHMLLEQAREERPYAMAAQSVVAEDVVPGFARSHPMPYVPADAIPRFWLGNAARVATHCDRTDNVAVVAAGRRRFTLFPPDQVANLYLGPLHFTPAGPPISMVHVTEPDLDRYPRFAKALEAAETAELEPGDAIFIPYGWYHHVEALERLNLLVNYWWNPAPEGLGSPSDAILLALLSVRSLPEDQRSAWRAMFDYYVFQLGGDPAEHIPDEVAGVLGPMTPDKIAEIRKSLIEALERDSTSKFRPKESE